MRQNPRLSGHTTIWVDLSDFLYRLGKTGKVDSGVGRVVEKLLSAKALQDSLTIRFCVFYGDPLQVEEIPKSWFMRSVNESGKSRSKEKLSRKARQLFLSYEVEKYTSRKKRLKAAKYYGMYFYAWARDNTGMQKADIQPGDILFLPSGGWALYDYVGKVAHLKKNRGLFLATLVHDVIPLTHPQFLPEKTLQSFKRYFEGIFPISDQIITTSDYSRRAIAAYTKEKHISVPIGQFCLGDADKLLPEEGKLTADHIVGEKAFVLSVGLFTERKNFHRLFEAWEKLQMQKGDDLPILICVGKFSAFSKQYHELYQRYKGKSGKIQIWSEVDTKTLDALYRGCLFTVFPSLAEGWGLPVSESLAYGKVCLASNATSIPEVAGDRLTYFDPYDAKDISSKMAALLSAYENHPKMPVTRSGVSSGKKIFTWDMAAEMLLLNFEDAMKNKKTLYNEFSQ